MKKTRAAGGGRKPLNPNEKTTKVAVTLLPSQVEAMEQLGNGNLSKGIRKAIDMNMQEHLAPEYKPTKKSIAAVRRWWKAGKNIWEISQLTGLSESEVTHIVRDFA